MTKVVTSIVVVALLFLGGPVLRGFSEALLIGIIAGTYSSIYISSAMALSCGLKAEHLFPSVQRPHRRPAVRGELAPMLELLTDPQAWIAFVTLSALEIVLGIDNIIFISILVSRLPPEQRESARISGLAFAMITRVALLFSIVWLTRLTKPWFSSSAQAFSGRDLILFFGGLFLLAKSVLEIHHTLEGAADERKTRVFASFMLTVVQIGIIDIVFSLDSVFTAVGLANPTAADHGRRDRHRDPRDDVAVGLDRAFVDRHPTIKILALAFLILIGVALVAESLHFEIPKGYLYFAMAFSVGVEMINIRLRRLIDDAPEPERRDEGG